MKINKLFVLVFMTLVFLVQSTANVSAATYSSVNVNSVSVNGRENQTTVTGSKPQVTSNNFSTTLINDSIDGIYKSMTKKAASDRAKSINFSYNVYQNTGYISVVINGVITNATQTQSIDSVTFYDYSGQIVNLSDVIGGRPINVIDTYVDKNLGTNVTLDSNTNFYMHNNVPTITFNSYELGQSQSQAVSVPIDLSQITSYQLSSMLYYTKSNFNMRMVPLRKTCEGLYYSVNWNGNNKSFTVRDGNTVAVGSVNSNIYTINNKTVRLENSPEMRNGTLYVPISFFTDVLGISYSIGDSGNATFYKVK